MAVTQPTPMPPISSSGGGMGNWFSTHKGLAIGGGIVGVLVLYYLYTKMKSSGSSSSTSPNVSSGSGTVDILTGPQASQSGTPSGMGEQAYYAQLQALQSGIDTQLQNQIASSGTGTGTGTGTVQPSTTPNQPVVSTPYTLQGSGYTNGATYGYQPLSNPSQALAAYKSGQSVYYEPSPGMFQAVPLGMRLAQNTPEYIA